MTLLEALRAGPLLGDGAMGTQLQFAGLEPGGCGEAWNLDAPDAIEAIQSRYVEAGSQVLLSNTFGASRVMLERHGQGDRSEAINRAGVEIARRAFGDKRGYVFGDMGPFGGLLEPLGDVPIAAVEAAFAEQAKALVEAGVDAILIETQTSLEELRIGIEAARAAGAEVVAGSMAFDRTYDGEDVRTMMGIGPEDAARFMSEMKVDILALNCGTGVDMSMAREVVARYRAISDLPIMAQPNAGQPVLEDFKTVYKETPEEMSAGVAGLIEVGVGIIGGCCGSTPDHIRAFARTLQELAR
ncbi:MAG: 5-methyltetrahydrofolate--homocysteine methyltransferase [Planctomycetota bacterium]|jgi:5-methyltetrahydrofolate--homocysteine methyltransferase